MRDLWISQTRHRWLSDELAINDLRFIIEVDDDILQLFVGGDDVALHT